MEKWSVVVCKAIFDAGSYSTKHSQVRLGMNSILRQIREVERTFISKQFLHKKLSRLIAAGLVSRAKLRSNGAVRGRGRPTSFVYFLTARGLNYLKLKGAINRGDSVLMSKKLDVLMLGIPENEKSEQFVSNYYKKLGFEVVKTKKLEKLVHTETKLPAEVVAALNEEITGAPDLFVHKRDFSEYFFVECKSPNTGLSSSKIKWILSNPGLPLKLVFTEREKSAKGELIRIFEDDYTKLQRFIGKMQAERGKKVSAAEAVRYILNTAYPRCETAKISLQNASSQPQWHVFSLSERGFILEDRPKSKVARASKKKTRAEKREAKPSGGMRLFSLKRKQFVE